MKVLITGGSGFIGSNLAKELSKEHEVTIYDNLSAGKYKFVQNLKVKFIKGDILNFIDLKNATKNQDMIFHLASNSDVRNGEIYHKIDLEQNLLGTINVLESMLHYNIKKIMFSSTSTIYGKVNKPIKESYAPLKPQSRYGASKLCCEAYISAYSYMHNLNSTIFRFANIVGSNSTHGIIFDFINKLKNNPNTLKILGDGNQIKSYLHVSDCIKGIKLGINHNKKLEIFNIGTESQTDVKTIAKIVSEEMKLNPEYKFTGGKIGWKGDIPKFIFNLNKIKKLGFKTKYNSTQAVKKAVQEALI